MHVKHQILYRNGRNYPKIAARHAYPFLLSLECTGQWTSQCPFVFEFSFFDKYIRFLESKTECFEVGIPESPNKSNSELRKTKQFLASLAAD